MGAGISPETSLPPLAEAMTKRKKTIRRPALEPRTSTYVPPPCTSCQTLRPKARDGSEQNYSRVYAVRKSAVGVLRYIRCGFCGISYKDLSDK